MVIAIYLVILVAAFYFLIVRPQRRQSMVRRQLLSAVEEGDEIVTSGGVYGTVVAIQDETLDVEIADGVVVKVARGAVAARVGPETEWDGEEEDEGDDEAHDEVEYDGDLDEVGDEDEEDEEDDDGDGGERPRGEGGTTGS